MITLSTSVYEKDFKFTLNKNNWFYNFKSPSISKKIVIINNINNIDEFLLLKKEFENDFEFYYSSEILSDINKTFNLNIDISEPSYYYSVHHYSTIIVNTINEYTFHVSSDCIIHSDNFEEFFNKSIDILNSDETVITTTMSWLTPENINSLGEHCQKEFNIQKTNDNFYFTKVMSDQVYFYKTEKLKKCDFTNTNYLHPSPIYGINSFEYRLTNYFITNNKYRALYKNKSYYTHKSF